MCSILDSKDNFVCYEEYKSNCFQNCIRQILEYKSINHSHLLINTDFNFKIKYDSLGLNFQIVNKHKKTLNLQFDKYIIYPDVNKFSEQKMIDFEKNLLNDKIVPIVGVDIYYLNYCKNYNYLNSFHWILVGEYTHESVAILDIGQKIKFCGNIPIKEYIKARTSKNPQGLNFYSGIPIKKCLAFLDEELFSVKIDYSKLILESLENAYEYYFPSEDEGINAIPLLKEIIRKMSEETFDEQRVIDYLYYNLYDINKYRKLFFLTLKYIYNNFDFQITEETVNLFGNIVEKWNNCIALIVKLKYLKKKSNVLFTIMESLDKIAVLESEMKKHIALILSNFKEKGA